MGHGNDQRIQRQFLCNVEIAHDTGQTRDEPGPFNTKVSSIARCVSPAVMPPCQPKS
jgi:hypothetical protein